ncbi:hypothetical protein GF386_00200 [Candidatus Pacearchaeota archaeon]|nr:hypothetical protein [Candidatus Pacearchaeota archaeon]MBD3282703.1 hypothetical protein [Candidatus Pacearchaeota archaeon]
MDDKISENFLKQVLSKPESGKSENFLKQVLSKPELKINKKSQVTIFVVLGLMLIVLILIFLLLLRPAETEAYDEENPQAYIESCTRDATEEAIEIISEHGGDIHPRGSVLYKGIDRTFLCYNSQLYKKCINQRPLLIEHIQKEIENYIYPKVYECFQALQKNLEQKYEIENPDDLKINARIQSRHVSVEIDKYFSMKNEEDKKEFEKFTMNLVHPMYNLAEIAMEIVNQEAKYCDFNAVGYMVLHNEFDIKRFITGDSNTLYTIEERASGQKFTFAVRSCVLPPGL